MTRQWVVLFEGRFPSPADDFTIVFTDTRGIMGKIPLYNTSVYDRLLELIKNEEKYYIYENIKAIKPPERPPFSSKRFFIILATDVNKLKFGLLLVRTEETLAVCGVWPSELVEQLNNNPEILDGIVYMLIACPENWENVCIVCAP